MTALADAKSPVVYVGGGILLAKARVQLQEFVEHMGLVVAHSLMGKGALPDTHPHVLGMSGFWGIELINRACLNADCVFALGTRFKKADCLSWYLGFTFNIGAKGNTTRVIHIDIEPQEIGKNYPIQIGLVADVKAVLKVLIRVTKRLCPNELKCDAKVFKLADFRRAFKARNLEMQISTAFH